MAVSPVPVVVLFLLAGPRKIVIFFMVFLEIPPVRPIFVLIPIMEIVVSFIFVTPALLGTLISVLVVALLGADSPNAR
jgi:hypothetical protein